MISYKNYLILSIATFLSSVTLFLIRQTPTLPIKSVYSSSLFIKDQILGTSTINTKSLESQDVRNFNQPINILLLGFDGRIGDKNPRCDALHVFSFYQKDQVLKITSIPRGTMVSIPGYINGGSYIGNACHIAGVDFVISEIEKLSELKINYVFKTGFSQSMGIFRSLGLSANDTLMSLRTRKYGIGDFQRSHNHAVFFKDAIINYTDRVAGLPKSLLYLFYKTIDANVSFETAYNLFTTFKEANIHKNPDRIILAEAPAHNKNIKDLHIDSIGQLTKTNQQEDDPEFQAYQQKIQSNLNLIISRGKTLLDSGNREATSNYIQTPYKQHLWLQLEDKNARNKSWFDMLYIYSLTSNDLNEVTSDIIAFVIQADLTGEEEFKMAAIDLLDKIQK